MTDPSREIRADTIAELLDREGMAPEALRELLLAIHPVDLASLLEDLDPPDRARLLTMMPDAAAVGVISAMDPIARTSTLEHVDDASLARCARDLEADLLTDIVQALPHRRRDKLVADLPAERREQIRQLGRYASHTAGGLMNPNFVTIPKGASAATALAEVKRAAHVESITDVYVVDAEKRLAGRFPLRDLLTHLPTDIVDAFTETDVRSVPFDLDQEEVARIVADYDLTSVPVVDRENRMIGVVTVDDVIDVIQSEASEDIHRMVGAGAIDPVHDPAWRRYRLRIPWLAVPLVVYPLIALIMKGYEEMLGRIAMISAFIPYIMAMGGNVGLQSATIVMRGLATGQVTTSRAMRVIGLEVLTGALMGVTAAVLGAAVAYGLQASHESAGVMAAAVGVAMVTAMTISCVWGAAVPLLLHRMRIDPAVASGPFITSMNDLIGVTVYLLVATLIVG